MRPVPEFLNIPGLVKDMQKITDAARGKWMSNIMMGLTLLKHYNPYKSPSQFTLYELFKKFDKSFGLTGKDYGKVERRSQRRRYREASFGSLELPVYRRHVVPGSLQLRLPSH